MKRILGISLTILMALLALGWLVKTAVGCPFEAMHVEARPAEPVLSRNPLDPSFLGEWTALSE